MSGETVTRHPGSSRQSPMHCPYCGEDDALFPREDGWECRGCLRAFSVTYLGQLTHPARSDQPPQSGGAR